MDCEWKLHHLLDEEREAVVLFENENLDGTIDEVSTQGPRSNPGKFAENRTEPTSQKEREKFRSKSQHSETIKIVTQ